MKRKHAPLSRLLIIPLLALFLLSPLTPNAAAQSKSVTVLRRDAEITILSNGDIHFEEVWETRFEGGPFTFAFRSIPLNKVEEITNWGVREGSTIYSSGSGSTPFTYKLSSEGGERKITWYFLPTTNQTRTFTLSYTLKGALAIYDEGDQFFWKFIESDRGYTINSASVTVRLPAAFSTEQLEGATFFNGDATSDWQIVDGQTIAYRGGPFYSGDEWEIGVKFPHGVVNAAPPPWQSIADNQWLYNLEAIVAALIFLISGGMGVYLIWYLWGRDKPVGVMAEFFPRPPDDSPPAVAGTLIDERADMQDIIASLVDLARRGYLKIVEKPSIKPLAIKSDFTFVRSEKDDGDLLPYERRLLRSIFGRKTERDLNALKNKFYTKLPAIKEELYEEVVARGFFSTSPEKVRARYDCFSALLLIVIGGIAFIIFAVFTEYTPLAGCVSGSLIVFPIGLLILSQFMPRKTERGARAAAQWKAFQRYLKNIDKYTDVAEAKEQFERYLPYAIAFGLEKTWVEKFAAVDAPVPVWWETYYPIHPTRGGARRGMAMPASGRGRGSGVPSLDQAAGGAFSGLEAMSTGLFTMLDSASSILTSAPSSSGSGGGGGGGFSGGGGGGGGSSGFG